VEELINRDAPFC